NSGCSRSQFTQNPTVQLSPLGHWMVSRCGGKLLSGELIQRACYLAGTCKAIDLRIDGEETQYVPQSQQKLGDAIADGAFRVDDRAPRGLVGEEIPPQRIGPVLVKNLLRAAVIAQ